MSPEMANGRKQWLACLALVGLVAAVFGRAAGQGFVNIDDHDYLSKNLHVQQGLTVESVRWAFTTGAASNWHPLTWLSHMVDWQLFGPWAGGHHLVSIGIHAVNACLAFICLQRLLSFGALDGRTPLPRSDSPQVADGKKPPPRPGVTTARVSVDAPSFQGTRASRIDFWIALAVAAIYAIHPLRVESVVWASERKDVLSTLFWWLVLLVYVPDVSQADRPISLRRWGAICGLLALGLLAKPMLVTLPAVLVLLDIWPLRRCAGEPNQGAIACITRSIMEKWPLWLSVFASSVVTYLVQQAGGAVLGGDRYPLGARLAVVLHSYVKYLTQTVWPVGLCAFYPVPLQELAQQGLAYRPALAAAACLSAATAVCVWQARQRPYLLVGWLWYVGTLAPVIGLVKVGDQYHADRYTYVPQFGLLLALAFGVQELLRRSMKWAWPVAATAAAFALSLAGLCYQQVGTWRDTETLARHALNVTQRNHIAHYLLGVVMAQRGEKRHAMEQFEQALRHNSNYFVARLDLALFQVEFKEFEIAEKNLRIITKQWPRLAPPHQALAAICAKHNDFSQALDELDAALSLDPQFAMAHLGRGDVLMTLDRPAEAAAAYGQALDLGSPNPELVVKRAEALGRCAQAAQAEALLRPYLAAGQMVTPELQGRASYLLGLMVLQQRRPAEAAAIWDRALAEFPWRVETANDLAWLLAAGADASLHDGSRALELAQQCCTKVQPTAALLDTLAAAQARAGDFAAAVATIDRALADPSAAKDAELAAALRERRLLYGQRQAYEELP